MLKKIEVIGLLSPDYPPANIIHCHLEHNLLLGTWLAWIKTPLNKQGWVRVRWLQNKTELLCISSHLVISCDLKRNTWKFLKGWGKSRSNLCSILELVWMWSVILKTVSIQWWTGECLYTSHTISSMSSSSSIQCSPHWMWTPKGSVEAMVLSLCTTCSITCEALGKFKYHPFWNPFLEYVEVKGEICWTFNSSTKSRKPLLPRTSWRISSASRASGIHISIILRRNIKIHIFPVAAEIP